MSLAPGHSAESAPSLLAFGRAGQGLGSPVGAQKTLNDRFMLPPLYLGGISLMCCATCATMVLRPAFGKCIEAQAEVPAFRSVAR